MAASAKMPAYIGTKIVCAVPMNELAWLRDNLSQTFTDKPDRAGYMVVYADGYRSWSPRETFKANYRLVTVEEGRLI